MKSFKIKKSELADLPKLLTRVGAVHDNRAYVSDVYVNPRTGKSIQRAIRAALKKQHSYLTGKKLEASIAMEWLNLGPAELDGVADGVIIVDDNRIKHLIATGGTGA